MASGGGTVDPGAFLHRRSGALAGLYFHAGAARLRKSDGNCLLGRPGTMLARTDVIDLLLHELTSLGARAFSSRFIRGGTFQGLGFRHGRLLLRTLVSALTCNEAFFAPERPNTVSMAQRLCL